MLDRVIIGDKQWVSKLKLKMYCVIGNFDNIPGEFDLEQVVVINIALLDYSQIKHICPVLRLFNEQV